MSIKLSLPTTKPFHLKLVDGALKVTDSPDGRDGFVTFRQATVAEVERRTGEFSSRRTVLDEDGSLSMVESLNLDYKARLEIALTLADTDIEMADGSRLEFTGGSVSSVKDRKKFDEWWNAMPPHWAAELHRCCLQVNPVWGTPKSSL